MPSLQTIPPNFLNFQFCVFLFSTEIFNKASKVQFPQSSTSSWVELTPPNTTHQHLALALLAVPLHAVFCCAQIFRHLIHFENRSGRAILLFYFHSSELNHPLNKIHPYLALARSSTAVPLHIGFLLFRDLINVKINLSQFLKHLIELNLQPRSRCCHWLWSPTTAFSFPTSIQLMLLTSSPFVFLKLHPNE